MVDMRTIVQVNPKDLVQFGDLSRNTASFGAAVQRSLLGQVASVFDSDGDPSPTVAFTVTEGQQVSFEADSNALGTVAALSSFEIAAATVACDGVSGTCDVTVTNVASTTARRRRRVMKAINRRLSESTRVSARLSISRKFDYNASIGAAAVGSLLTDAFSGMMGLSVTSTAFTVLEASCTLIVEVAATAALSRALEAKSVNAALQESFPTVEFVVSLPTMVAPPGIPSPLSPPPPFTPPSIPPQPSPPPARPPPPAKGWFADEAMGLTAAIVAAVIVVGGISILGGVVLMRMRARHRKHPRVLPPKSEACKHDMTTQLDSTIKMAALTSTSKTQAISSSDEATRVLAFDAEGEDTDGNKAFKVTNGTDGNKALKVTNGIGDIEGFRRRVPAADGDGDEAHAATGTTGSDSSQPECGPGIPAAAMSRPVTPLEKTLKSYADIKWAEYAARGARPAPGPRRGRAMPTREAPSPPSGVLPGPISRRHEQAERIGC